MPERFIWYMAECGRVEGCSSSGKVTPCTRPTSMMRSQMASKWMSTSARSSRLSMPSVKADKASSLQPNNNIQARFCSYVLVIACMNCHVLDAGVQLAGPAVEHMPAPSALGGQCVIGSRAK